MDDRVLGAGVLGGSLLGIAVYFWLVFLTPWSMFIIQLSAFFIVAALLIIVAWIGYTMATTPAPAPPETFSEEESIAEKSGEEESAEKGRAQKSRPRIPKVEEIV